MNIRATPRSAVLAGVWCALGMSAVESLQQHFGWAVPWWDAAFLAGAVVFFFVPVLLFVAGQSTFAAGWRDMFSSQYWCDLYAVGVRGLWWLLGASIGFTVLWLAGVEFRG